MICSTFSQRQTCLRNRNTDGNHCFQTRKEREIQQQMLARDEETVELRETFTSLQQEVEAKTKKLKKVNGAQNAVSIGKQRVSVI